MNRDRWLMRWWDCKSMLKEWLPRFSLLWYLIGCFIFATIMQEILPYITPQKRWPDWAIALVMIFMILGAVTFLQPKQTFRRQLTQYLHIQEQIEEARKTLEQAKREKWSERAIDNCHEEIVRLRSKLQEIESQ